jgi:hypothetical protein
MNELDQVYRAIVHWGVPLGVLGMLHYLQQISKRLNEISLSLATVVTRLESHQGRLEDHDRRLSKLESRRA